MAEETLVPDLIDEEEREEREPGEQHIIFALGDVACAARIDSVQEIERVLDAARVPGTPPWVEGVANLRGNIITVVDLRSFMGMPRLAPGRTSRTLVARAGDSITGLIVDRVNEIRYLRPEEIRSPGPNQWSGLAPYLRGLYQLEDRLLAVVDLAKLLLCDRMSDLGNQELEPGTIGNRR